MVRVVFTGGGTNNDLKMRILLLISRFSTPETPNSVEFDGFGVAGPPVTGLQCYK